MPRAVLVLLSLGLLAGKGGAQGTPSQFRWDELQKQGRLSAGVLLPPDAATPFHHLKVENTHAVPTSVTVWTLDRPSISGPRYAVTGQVRYDAVEAPSYLELWNHFPGGGQYFTRTLGESGAMQKLMGSSGWRSFALPFDATGAPPPTRLVLNVVLAGRGRVELGPLTLVEQSTGHAELGAAWTDRAAGLIGGLGGGLIGCLGAIVGVLTSLGRARRLVMVLTLGLIAVGVLALVGGLIAVAASQPYAVFYPLLLIGVLASAVPLGLLPTIRRRYAEIELRTMRAYDIG